MKTNVDGLFKTDKKEAEEGKEFEVAPGVFLTIRKASSKVSQDTRRRLESAYAGKVPKSMEETVSIRHIAQGIVAGWRGWVINEEKQVDYDWKVMEQLLLQDDMGDLRDLIIHLSTNDDNYRVNEDQVKN
jgi:hypothetical protein